ncbi:MAG TPA: mechanosensitive ion channel family protein [Gemmatimonadales bacterium]|nr:mechanosensitive ion channel family protein [Gemmatimonadales bacterium]
MQGFLAEATNWSMPALALTGGIAAGLAAQRLLLPLFARAAARSSWKYDDALVAAIRGPVLLWFVLLGTRLALRLLPLRPETEQPLGMVVLVAGILSVTWAAARFTSSAMRTATAQSGYLPGVSLLANVAKVLVFAVGLLVVLQTLGISITPLVTALGIGGLAVGLALQDTLANFFAGLRILASRKIRPGDFIRLESGQEGFVEDITWGQVTIRQTGNNLVLVPNAKLAQAITTNFSLPDPPQTVVIGVGVAYGTDLEKAERVTIEVAREVMGEIAPRLLAAWEPVVRYHTFGDSAIQFNAVLRAPSYDDRWLMQHNFIKRLHSRFEREGIEIPFPVRTVVMKSGGGG